MITSSTSAQEIASTVGERLKRARLGKNLKQEDLARLTGLSRKVIVSGEKGRLTVESLASIMIALGQAEAFEALLPEVPFSPVQLLKLKGKERKRARGGLEGIKAKPTW
ncbi:MAG: helix-turn-helix transcriptional regulator [Cellvibrio sp.]|uniref:helix-turn-helix domain-containing protein n=1 Tax=Cellvibrio sp. TaxID=1965322 RepID=UPI0031A2B3F2